MKRSSFSILWAVVAFSVLLVGFAIRTLTANQVTQQRDDVHAALLKVVLQRVKKPAFVAFDKKDPSDAFIRRMAGQKIQILKMSDSPHPFVRGRGGAKRLKNPQLDIGPPRWITPKKVEVVVNWPGAGTRYTLVLISGQWSLRSKEKVWIS